MWPWTAVAAEVQKMESAAAAARVGDWRAAFLREAEGGAAAGAEAWERVLGVRAALPAGCRPEMVVEPQGNGRRKREGRPTLSAEALRAAGDGATRGEARELRRRIGPGLDLALGTLVADGAAARCAVGQALGRRGDPWRAELWSAMELLLTPDGPTDAEAAGRWRAARDRVGQGAVEADLGTLAAAGLWWHARVGEAAATLAALPGDEWPLEPLIVATSLGPLWIGSPDTNAGSGSPWLLVDPGGDDAWSFAEVDGVPGSPVRAFIDLGGDDTWRSADLGPGGAAFGLTTGWEQEGNDLYDGGALSWGAAFFGVAGWIDRAGDDVWNGGVGNFGWAAHGLALLRDDAGADRYTLDTLGLGVAGAGGHAVAVDADGRATSRFVGPRRPLGQGAVDPDERARTGRAGLWVNGGTARWSGRGAGDQERGILLGPPNGLTPEAEVPELVRVLWELATGQGDAERLRRAALGSAEAPSALAQHASDPALGPDERRVALTVLAELPARIGDGEAVLAALRLWEGFHDDPDLGTRRAAWRLLQAWCEAGAGFDSVGRVHVEQAGLTALQGERDAATWDAVAATLGRVGSGAVAPALAEALPPGRSERVHRALDALTRLLDRGETAAVVRVLFPLVTEPGRLDPGTLRPVLAVLGRTGHRDLVGLISERREDADPRVRLAVADLAGQVKDREVVGILRKWERAETEESVRVAIAAALAVKR